MSKSKEGAYLPPDNNPNYTPLAYQSAGRIIQILTQLSLQDAQQALSVVNQMFGKRLEDVDKPAFAPEDVQ